MSITYPTFTDKEIVSPEKLNAFVQAIEAKFTAGLGTADISWPLTADGALNMVDNAITGGTTIMGIVHAGTPQYADFDAAMTAGANGIVFIPPNTTLRVDGAQLAGTNIAIVGAGPSSVLKLTESPSAGYMLRNTTGVCNFLIANLTLDGNDGASSDGLVLRNVSSAIVHNVIFKNWSQSALKITYMTGSSSYSNNVRVTDCSFRDGSDHHILCDSGVDIVVKGCISDGCDTKAFEFVAVDGDARMARISIVDNSISTCDEECIRVIGGSGTPSAKWVSAVIQGNHCYGDTGTTTDMIVLGDTGGVIQGFTLSDNVLMNCIADGIYVSADNGVVANNTCESCGSDALELEACSKVKVCGNMFANATHYGIKVSDADECQVHDNDVANAGTGGVQLPTIADSADFIQYNNRKQVGVPPISGFVNRDGSTTAVDGAVTCSTITLPANFLQPGMMLTLDTAFQISGNAVDGISYMRLDGNNIAQLRTVGGGGDECYGHCVLVVESTTEVKAIFHSYSESSAKTKYIGSSSVGGLDLTSALDLAVYLDSNSGDASSQLVGRGLYVAVTRVDDQSA